MSQNMDNTLIVNVVADTYPADISQTLPMLRILCSKSLEIKTKLTSTLSKTSFDDITPAHMSGKGNCKITKQFLAESVISLIKQVDSVEPLINSEPPILYVSTSSSVVDRDPSSSALDTYLTDVQSRLDGYCSTMQANQQQMDDMVKKLSSLVMLSKPGPASEPASPGMVPNTQSPHAVSVAVCDPYVRYTQNLITDAMKTSLDTFINSNEAEFKTIGNSRDTLYFGEYGYKYSGGEHKAKEIPAPLQELRELVRTQLSDPESVVNSCLITRYKSGSDFIPPHRDDEPLFNPESEIITVSVGSTRTMKFVDNSGENSQELKLEDRSVLVSSRKAQDFWQHSIEKTDEACGVRYSFTFRHIAPHFLNSTVIIGDSNTKLLQFGEDKGKFGKWMPGKRVEALHLENIPDASDIGPYRNIVIHTGINNIKNRNRQSNRSLSNILETSCKNIISTYPKCKIYLSLLLPTKLESLNYRVREFNNVLHDLSNSFKNVNIIDHLLNELCNSHGCLRDELGRYDREAQDHLARDKLHLGKKGLRLFAKTIKSCVIGKFRNNSTRSGQQEATSTGSHRDGYQPSG